jgi:hypothetical protein
MTYPTIFVAIGIVLALVKDFWTLGLIFGAIYLGVFLVIGVPISDFTRDRPGGIDDFGRGARDQTSRVPRLFLGSVPQNQK